MHSMNVYRFHQKEQYVGTKLILVYGKNIYGHKSISDDNVYLLQTKKLDFPCSILTTILKKILLLIIYGFSTGVRSSGLIFVQREYC